jgi:hypothetical protein
MPYLAAQLAGRAFGGLKKATRLNRRAIMKTADAAATPEKLGALRAGLRILSSGAGGPGGMAKGRGA